MSNSKRLLVLGAIPFLACMFVLSLPSSSAAVVSQSQAVLALGDAESAVISAYSAVSRADAVGANVTALLIRLNEAGEVLTRARTAYGLGDYDSVLELAALCQEKLEGFVAVADTLTNVTVASNNVDFIINVVAPIVGSVGIICVSLIVWLYLSRKKSVNDGK